MLSPVELLNSTLLNDLYIEMKIDRTGTNDGNILNSIAGKLINVGSVDTVFKSLCYCKRNPKPSKIITELSLVVQTSPG